MDDTDSIWLGSRIIADYLNVDCAKKIDFFICGILGTYIPSVAAVCSQLLQPDG